MKTNNFDLLDDSHGKDSNNVSITNIVKQLTTENISFSAERSTLPQIVNNQVGLVHVSNIRSGNFYAAKEEVLVRLIERSAAVFSIQPTFFDGMDEFKAGEPIGLASIQDVKPKIGEYTKQTVDKLSQLR